MERFKKSGFLAWLQISQFFKNVHKNSKEGPHYIKFTLLNYFYMFYNKIWFSLAVSYVFISFWTCQSDFEDQKKHKSDPCLGSFLAISEPNQKMTIFFLESLAPLYFQKKKSKTHIILLKHINF